jgi:hypothetical protein
MTHLVISKFSTDHFYHYFNPGKHLSDAELGDLHKTILNINDQAKSPLEHKLLDQSADMIELRGRYSSMIVCVIKVDGVDSGFLLSPLLQLGSRWIVHAGLVMINHNKGSNLLALAGTGTAKLAYERLGTYYSTNISSTPSIIENFTIMTAECWPGPQANLIRPPQHYREIAHALVNRYVKKYFPNPEAIQFDEKRFVLRSDSRNMGFSTDFRQVSKSSSFLYLNFCFCWLDYHKEEDLLQVGVIDGKVIKKMMLWRFLYALKLSKSSLIERFKNIAASSTVPASYGKNHGSIK